jgi:hypothetical protein
MTSTPTHPLSVGYQCPGRVAHDAWRDYLTGHAGTIERARDLNRLVASLDAADIEATGGQLRALQVPALRARGQQPETSGRTRGGAQKQRRAPYPRCLADNRRQPYEREGSHAS